MSRKHGGEKYVKSFDGYTHLLTMLYAVIQRFDSLREIETSMTAEVRKLHHVGIDTVPKPRKSLQKAHKSKIGVCLIQKEAKFLHIKELDSLLYGLADSNSFILTIFVPY